MIKTKHDLMMIRHTQILIDPFPQHSTYQSISEHLKDKPSFISKLFFKMNSDVLPKPDHISIHAAYRMGYDQAYKEIAERLTNEAQDSQV